MPVRRNIPYNQRLFFITFTCYKWLPLIEQTKSYDLICNWFDYLKQQNHSIAGYVIVPNYVHLLINFATSAKKINIIIGDGKCFIAYELINLFAESGEDVLLQKLEKAVSSKDKKNGKRHEV